MSAAPRRVAVVGLGVATSLGCEVEELWRALLEGRSGVARIRQFPSDAFPVSIGSEVDLAALQERLGERAAGLHGNRTLTFATWAAERAWCDAGLDGDGGLDPRRAAVCLGAGLFPAIEDRLEGLTPDLFDDEAAPFARTLELLARRPGLLAQQDLGAVSLRLSRRFGLSGPSVTVHSACASATQAIGQSWEMVRHGQADVVLTGGADSMLSMFCVAGFTLLGALSRRADPATASRPFDLQRDGFVLGEGAGVLVLEELQHALRRGARVLCELAGYGSSLDAWRFTDVHPQGRGAADCLRRALDAAGIAPEAVDYVNAHGTSTWQNDRVETRALHEVFGAHARRLAVSSTKSQLGHLLCAAGGVEAVVTALALRDQVLPPTLNLEQRDPDCDLDYVAGRSRPARVDVALSNSFGFGGQNATLVLRRVETGRGRAAHGLSRERRVVVTGLGAVSCLGSTFDEHWRRLLRGDAGVRVFDDARRRRLPLRLGAPVTGLRVDEFLRNRMLRKLLLPSATFAVEAAGQALRDAGLAGDEARLRACGLSFGSVAYELPGRTFEPALRASFGSDGHFDFARFARVGLELVDPLLIVKGLPNAAPCGVAIEHGLRGPNLSVSHGTTCGLHAATAAFEAVRRGTLDVVLAGASDSLLLAEHVAAHQLAGRLLRDDEAHPPVGARPFDARRAGYVLGEGSAACVFESEEHARARGARVYAELRGVGEVTGPAQGAGLAEAAERATRASGAPQVIFGVGLGLPDEDAREAAAARAVLASRDSWLTAATGALGLTGAASGAFALVHAAQSLAQGLLPPTTGHSAPAADCDVRVPLRAQAQALSRALVWSSDGARHVALSVAAAR